MEDKEDESYIRQKDNIKSIPAAARLSEPRRRRTRSGGHVKEGAWTHLYFNNTATLHNHFSNKRALHYGHKERKAGFYMTEYNQTHDTAKKSMLSAERAAAFVKAER